MGLFGPQVRIVERRIAGEQVVQRAAQAVDVGADVDAGGLPLLGRHVHAGAHRLVVEPREPVVGVAGQQREAQVENLHDRRSTGSPAVSDESLWQRRRRRPA